MLEPKVTYLADSHVYQYGDIEVVLDRFVEDKRDGLKAEIEVRSSRPPTPGLIHYGRIALTSTESRAKIIRACEARSGDGWHDDTDFGAIIGDLSIRSIKRWREGEPAVDLTSVEPGNRPRWKLRPFLEYGGPTVLFAYGESGKSLLALALSVDLAAGSSLLGEPQEDPCPVMYLDWEADQYTHGERLQALLTGSGVTLERPVYYRRMLASLTESAYAVRKELAVLGVGAVVIDSMGMARGGDAKEAAPTIDFFRSVRSLGVPALILDHLPKEGDGNNPYGSIYTTNLARITWRLDAAKEEGRQEYHVALTNKKGNNVGRLPRMAYRVAFDVDPVTELLRTVTLERCDPLDVPDFAATASLSDRILRAIDEYGPMEPQAIAEELGLDERERKQLYPRLRDLRRRGLLAKDPATGRYGRLYRGAAHG